VNWKHAYRATTTGSSCPAAILPTCGIDQPDAMLWPKWLAKRPDVTALPSSPPTIPVRSRLPRRRNAERQAQLECDLIEGNYEPYAGRRTCRMTVTGRSRKAASYPIWRRKMPVHWPGITGKMQWSAVARTVCPHLVWVEETE
jgi:hypothetical protein